MMSEIQENKYVNSYDVAMLIGRANNKDPLRAANKLIQKYGIKPITTKGNRRLYDKDQILKVFNEQKLKNNKKNMMLSAYDQYFDLIFKVNLENYKTQLIHSFLKDYFALNGFYDELANMINHSNDLILKDEILKNKDVLEKHLPSQLFKTLIEMVYLFK